MSTWQEVRAGAHQVPPAGSAYCLSKTEKAWARLAQTPTRPVRFMELAKTGEPEPRQGNPARGNEDVRSV